VKRGVSKIEQSENKKLVEERVRISLGVIGFGGGTNQRKEGRGKKGLTKEIR